MNFGLALVGAIVVIAAVVALALFPAGLGRLLMFCALGVLVVAGAGLIYDRTRERER
jgi:hypothetical protein